MKIVATGAFVVTYLRNSRHGRPTARSSREERLDVAVNLGGETEPPKHRAELPHENAMVRACLMYRAKEALTTKLRDTDPKTPQVKVVANPVERRSYSCFPPRERHNKSRPEEKNDEPVDEL
jgi:hypothetical protein